MVVWTLLCKIMAKYNVTEDVAEEIIENIRNTILNDYSRDDDILLGDIEVSSEELFEVL